MKLFVFPGAPSCRKVMAVVNNIKPEVDVQVVDLTKGEHKQDGFLAINPNGRVPALEDGELKLWESNAVAQYLIDSQTEESALFPKDVKIRAEISKWLFWEQAHYNKTIGVFAWENLAKPMFGMGDADQALIAQATEDLKGVAATLDAHLAKNDYLVGNTITLADYSVAGFSALYQAARIPMDSYENITHWLQRLEDDQAWVDSAPPHPEG